MTTPQASWRVFARHAESGQERFLGVLRYTQLHTARHVLRKYLREQGLQVEVPRYGTATHVVSRSGTRWTLWLRK
jgi:hypothetical protein